MRKKYKLIGTIWDRRKITLSRCPEIITEQELGYCEDYQTEYNLFDMRIIRRKINFSTLLRCRKKDELFKIAMRLKECDEVYLAVDYMPQTFNQIIARFYRKTLLQCFCFVKDTKNELRSALVMREPTAKKLLPYLCDYIPTKQ